jgi:hypothetical protein
MNDTSELDDPLQTLYATIIILMIFSIGFGLGYMFAINSLKG